MSGVSMSANRIAQTLTWLGGGEWRELGERHERSMHVIAGVVVLLGAALGWLVSPLAITEATHTPMALTLPLTLAFGLLIGAIARAIASGQHTAGRASSDARPSQSPSVPSSVNSPRSYSSPARSTGFS